MLKQFLFLTAVAIFAFSCQAIDKLTQFEIEYDSTVTISSSVGINLPFDVLTPDITTNSEQRFSDNNTSKELIEEIYVKEVVLNIQSPSGADFSFLEELSISITADGLPDKEMAFKKPVPSNAGATLTLDVSQADIQEYIKKAEFGIKVTATTDELMSTDHTIGIHTVLFVDAKVLGV